jgi:putative inorganic carbon (hco3(-)) transporter
MVWIIGFLFIMFIRPQDWVGSPVYGWPLYYIAIIGGLLAAMIGRKTEPNNLKTPVNVLLLIYLFIILLSNIVKGDVATGFDQIIAFGKRAIVYFMFIMLIDTPKKLKQALFYSMLFTAALGLQGIYQFQHGGIGWANQVLHTIGNMEGVDYQAIFAEQGARIFWIGLWDGPNVLCLAYLMTVAFCLTNIADIKKSFISKLIYLASFILLCYGIYLTNSRGGFMALGLVLLVFIFMRFKLKTAIISLLICIPVFLAVQPSRMAELNSEEESAHERTWIWEQGLNIFMDNKLIGVGKGKYAANNDIGFAAHNNYLAAAAETGIVGIMVYFALIYFATKSVLVVYLDRLRVKVHDDIFNMTTSVVPAIIGFCFGTFFVLMEHDILFIYFALCSSVYLMARKQNSTIVLKITKMDWALITVSVVGILYFIRLITEGKIFA